MRFVTLIGNPKAASRTATVAEAAGRAVITATGVQPRQETVDLSGLACKLLLAQPSAAVEDAVAQVLAADVLLVVSPTFKGTYTGLLKVFLDRLGYRALAGTVALPVLVMKHPEHALAVEVHMRPLLVELGATVPTPGLAVQEAALGRLEPVLATWARRVAGAVTSAGASVDASAGVAAAANGGPTNGGPTNGGKANGGKPHGAPANGGKPHGAPANGGKPHGGPTVNGGTPANGQTAGGGTGHGGSEPNGAVPAPSAKVPAPRAKAIPA